MTLGSYNMTHAEEISSLLAGTGRVGSRIRGRQSKVMINYSQDAERLTHVEGRMFALLHEKYVEETVQKLRGKPCA